MSHDRDHTGMATSRPLEEVVVVVAAPGLWAALVAMAPAAPTRGVVLVAGWVGMAYVLERRWSHL